MLATALHSPFITMALARKRLAFSTLKLENVLRSSLLVVAHVLENALRVGYAQVCSLARERLAFNAAHSCNSLALASSHICLQQPSVHTHRALFVPHSIHA